MNDPCDFVQFSYYGVILLSVISYHFSGTHKKLSVLHNEAKIAALGRALSGTVQQLLMTSPLTSDDKGFFIYGRGSLQGAP